LKACSSSSHSCCQGRIVPVISFIQSYSNRFMSLICLYVDLIDVCPLLFLRCTWAGDRDGQCISLVCWGIRIKPDDHVFLNRTTGIFRVLQTVLDDARTSMAIAADKSRGTGQQGSSTNALKAPLNISSGAGESQILLLMVFKCCLLLLQAINLFHMTLFLLFISPQGVCSL
jgi:hypothetical protein